MTLISLNGAYLSRHEAVNIELNKSSFSSLSSVL